MGTGTFSRDAFRSSVKTHTSGSTRTTLRAEQEAKRTGKLDPLVDPSAFGVIRHSRPRFLDELKGGLFELAVGVPMAKECRIDTTGSMGGNVDVALRVLPNDFELCSAVLAGYDLQIATGIFGDKSDNFPLCRPQFEMTAEKIVEQLTLMVPERAGDDFPEDPHYGLFGAAYLTNAHICKYGLKSYDFTVSDAPARDLLDVRELKRIFGDEVFDKVAENGYQVDPGYLTTKEVVRDLLDHAHAFFLKVDHDDDTTRFWTDVYGKERVVQLSDTRLLPIYQALIIGLTEGTLDLDTCEDFIRKQDQSLSSYEISSIVRSVAHIPIGAQTLLPNYGKLPQKGDLFRKKTDLWPVDPNEVATPASDDNNSSSNEVSWM